MSSNLSARRLALTIMTVDRWIRFVAGTFVLASLALAHFVSPWFLLMTLFVGVNLFQSSLTNFCPLTYVLRALGVDEHEHEHAAATRHT